MLHLDGFFFQRYQVEHLYGAAGRAIASCLSSSPIPHFLLETSLPSVEVTLIHFTLFSHERALRLRTSFSVSGLARLGVKPRLCRSSWRAFAFTLPLMLPSTSPRKVLSVYPPSLTWSPFSFGADSFFAMPPL